MSSAKGTADLIVQRTERLSEAIVAQVFAARPELAARFGDHGRSMCRQDTAAHLSFLAQAVAAAEPALFVAYVAWARSMLAARSIPVSDLADNLARLRAVVTDMLADDQAALVQACVEPALAELTRASEVPASQLETAAECRDLAQRYLGALLDCDRRAATALVLDAVEGGLPIRDVYLKVLQPVQREVGQLWQLSRMSVAQEHYCTAVTQQVMSLLYPRIFNAPRIGRTLIATCVAGEMHDVGIRMVADLLECEGWDTRFLGASTPAADLLRMLEQAQPDVLAVSVTITGHLGHLAELISRVRQQPALAATRIVVGGYCLNTVPDLWQRIGADGYGRDAGEAITVIRRLLPEGSTD